jgi:hypothetical protein
VAIPFVNSTNVVKLPNPRNSIHNALRYESLNPERKKWIEGQKLAEWADSRSSFTEVSNRQFGHSLYRLLGFRVFPFSSSYQLVPSSVRWEQPYSLAGFGSVLICAT